MKPIIYFIVIVALLYLVAMIFVYLLQEKIIFYPEKLNDNFQFSFNSSFEEKYFSPEKHARIHALHFKVTDPKGLVLYFHGNAGSLRDWGWVAEPFLELNYDVLIADYRGYGKSKGKLSEKALLEDAQFVYQILTKEYSENRLIVYGRSLGTGVAVHLAAHNNPYSLMLETPYHSLLDMAQSAMPIFPVKYLLKYPMRSDQWISKVACPVYIIHGTSDEVVPFKSGKELSRTKLENVYFTAVDGGNHNNLNMFPEYDHWLKNSLK